MYSYVKAALPSLPVFRDRSYALARWGFWAGDAEARDRQRPSPALPRRRHRAAPFHQHPAGALGGQSGGCKLFPPADEESGKPPTQA